MRESAQIMSRATLLPLAVTGGVLGFLLILVLMATPTRVIDAAVHFDVSVFAFFGRFAGRSWTVDTLIWSVWTHAAVQSGIVMVLVWGLWFAQGETPESRQTRASMLSLLVGVYASILLTLVLRVVLPFRARPMVDPTSTFLMPYLPDGATPTAESTSFPSGHAAVLFALAIGLWSVSRALGLVAGLHGLFIVCLPRVYFGRHWATDIPAGASVALATVPVVNEMLRRSSLVPPAHPLRREGLARHVLHERDGALTHERDRLRVGAHAVARNAIRRVGGAEKDYWRRRLHITPASPTRAEPRNSSVEGSGVATSKSDCVVIVRLPRVPSDMENASCGSPVSTKLTSGEPGNGPSVTGSDVNEALKAPLVARLTVRRSLIGPVREPSRSAIDADMGSGITAPTSVALRLANSRLVMTIEPGMSVATMMLAVASRGSMNEIIRALAGPTPTITSPTMMSGTRIPRRSILRPEAWRALPSEFM